MTQQEKDDLDAMAQRWYETPGMHALPPMELTRFIASIRPDHTKLAATLAVNGLSTDGGHHKQWFLYQIALALGASVEGLYPGIAP